MVGFKETGCSNFISLEIMVKSGLGDGVKSVAEPAIAKK